VVDRIPDDARVNVHGCIRAYAWCDVSWRDARGWVQGSDLAYFYEQRYVPIVEYGPRIGLPIIVFSVDTYWNRYYRSRPWYGQRAHFHSVWRDRGGDRADRRPDRREGKIDRDRRDRTVDRTPNRTERKLDRRDRGDDRSVRRLDRRDTSRGERTRESRDLNRGARRDATPGRASPKPEASLRERPSGRPAGAPGRRDGGGGAGGDGERRDRN
jgi:uncharacterized protein YraI